jgi:putative transposase
MAAENVAVKLACRTLGVSESGYYEWRTRAPSARALRHVHLTTIIQQIHTDVRGVYGARRMHGELTLGRGIAVGRQAVEMLMRRAELHGVSGRPRYRHVPNTATASDLVDRKFARGA